MSFTSLETDKTENLSKEFSQNSKIVNFFPPKEWLYILFSLLLLIFSFLPAYSRQISFGSRINAFEPSYNMWGIFSRNGAPVSIDSFFLIWNMPFFSILLPVLAATLFIVRKVTQKPELTIGSLSVDQFASIAASISVFAIFVQLITITNSPPAATTLLGYTDSLEIGLILVLFASIAACFVSTLALRIKFLSAEIFARTETSAHPLARPPHFAPTQNFAPTQKISKAIEQKQETVFAFWFAVPKTKTVTSIDSGEEIFVIQPGTWNLALEEHQDHLIVQHPNGITGKLSDLHDIERA